MHVLEKLSDTKGPFIATQLNSTQVLRPDDATQLNSTQLDVELS